MTRRIALAFAALVAVLLVAAVLPLGAAMQSREEESFRFATVSDARQLTAAAEETLVDHHPPEAMNEAVAAAERHGDCAAVFPADGRIVAATACGTGRDAAGVALSARAMATKTQVTARQNDWLRAATPVGDADESAGAVVYARSAESLDHHVAAMWGWLALTAVACLGLGVALAFRLARWVARPLLALDTAASRLGDGALNERAPTEEGPPEVRRLARTFNRMAERTETLVHAHRGWVADVSHQLRTPLTALRLRLDVLAGEAEEASTSSAAWQGPELAVELAGVQEEIERLSRLVDGLLAVARAESVAARREAVPVAVVAAERVAAWEPLAREHGQELIADGSGGHAAAAAPLAPGDLEQILDNLIANALAAVPSGGRVRVESSTGRERDRVIVRVVDDGPGMADTAKQTAFRRFGNQRQLGQRPGPGDRGPAGRRERRRGPARGHRRGRTHSGGGAAGRVIGNPLRQRLRRRRQRRLQQRHRRADSRSPTP